MLPLIVRTVARLAASALVVGMLVAWAPHAEAAVEVTRAEYQKVQRGMTKARVRRIVGANGRVVDSYGSCVIKKYRGWNRRTVQFRWDDTNGDGVANLTGKTSGSDVVLLSCPRPM